jgi:hypothetical protein
MESITNVADSDISCPISVNGDQQCSIISEPAHNLDSATFAGNSEVHTSSMAMGFILIFHSSGVTFTRNTPVLYRCRIGRFCQRGARRWRKVSTSINNPYDIHIKSIADHDTSVLKKYVLTSGWRTAGFLNDPDLPKSSMIGYYCDSLERIAYVYPVVQSAQATSM